MDLHTELNQENEEEAIRQGRFGGIVSTIQSSVILLTIITNH